MMINARRYELKESLVNYGDTAVPADSLYNNEMFL